MTSPETARYIALKLSSRKNMVSRTHELTMVSRAQHPDGQALSYTDLPRETLSELKETFQAELARHGTALHPRMEKLYAALGV